MSATSMVEGSVMSPTTVLDQTQCRLEAVIEPDPVRVAQARHAASAILRLWGRSGSLVDDVQLVVSELVTNAIEHGRGPITMKITEVAGTVTVEVSDCNPVPAQVRSAQHDDLGGRGLTIVATLADTWGVSEDGCTTWAAFSSSEPKPAGPMISEALPMIAASAGPCRT
ncbi:ATP-binding protein [Streptomyces sp. NPDC014676]|uniref:ATP-binding protein n=1 Tax=Streptomyces sp. NPDC014676 TaxID=3364879 RepID=UPI0036F8655C